MGLQISKGNFYTLKNVTEQKFNPLALRLLYLQAHYRSELNFTWDSLAAAQNFLTNLYGFADLQFQDQFANKAVGETYHTAVQNIQSSLFDDLNSPVALGWLSGLSNQADAHGVDIKHLPELLVDLDKIFGLDLSKRKDISEDTKKLIQDREAARQGKDFAKSDQLRDQLLEEGIEIDDTAKGPRWKRLKP